MIVATGIFHLNHPALWVALFAAIGLGIVHGITPDEHTWPITFSYTIGSYSAKGGRKAGLLFSLSFAVQRAIAAELAYFALTTFQSVARWNYEIYVVVGGVMVVSGASVLRRGHAFHLSLRGLKELFVSPPQPSPVRSDKGLAWWMPLVHGFIAGWGVGAFAVILYTVLAPAMPSPWIAWLPGLLFGLGTAISQVVFGSIAGALMARGKMSKSAQQYLARMASIRTLVGSGTGFIVVGMLGIVIPQTLNRLSINTPVPVPNLDQLDVGFFLAVVVLFSVAVWAFTKTIREIHRMQWPNEVASLS